MFEAVLIGFFGLSNAGVQISIIFFFFEKIRLELGSLHRVEKLKKKRKVISSNLEPVEHSLTYGAQLLL